MSIAPVPGTILDFIAALNQGLQARQSLDSTLAQALRRLVDSWPDAEAARLYWPDGTEAASTDDSAAALSGVSVLESPLYNDGHWLVPLHDDGELLGVLEVTGALPDAEDWLQLVAVQLAQAIMQHEAQLLDSLTHGLSGARAILDVLRSLHSLVPSASQLSRASAVYYNQQLQDLVITHTLTGDQESLVSTSLREAYGADVIAAMTHFPTTDTCLSLTPNPTDESQTGSAVVMPFFDGDILREVIHIEGGGTQPFTAHTRRLLDAAHAQAGIVLHALQQVSDVVEVTLELDTEPRIVDVPDDLAAALETAGVREAFDKLAPSRRKEHVRQVETAKAEETRSRRIARIVEQLAEA